ncbi:MAG TPA: YcaO-like family protein [Polyangiaceae bacterium]|nr:YcaO-like family protein [Polyangiaceae bacterium]
MTSAKTPDALLSALAEECPLPPGATAPELFIDSTQLGALELQLVGFSSEIAGELCTGSAVERGDESVQPRALRRAYFELVERLSICGAIASGESFAVYSRQKEPLGRIGCADVFPQSSQPERWRYARSNGVAIAPDWDTACERAQAEAIERDLVLRTWFGAQAWQALGALDAQPWHDFDELLEVHISCCQWLGFWVVMGIGFPRSPADPTVIGLGARRQLADASSAALGEFTQRAAFLWGEQIPEHCPAVTPDAHYHQEYSLWAGANAGLRSWLARQPHLVLPASNGQWSFADLTPSHLQGRACVVRAMSAGALPLVFGEGFPGYPPGFGQPHPVA